MAIGNVQINSVDSGMTSRSPSLMHLHCNEEVNLWISKQYRRLAFKTMYV